MSVVELLRPFQREAAGRIATLRSALLADQPGLGKTFTALGAMQLAGALTPGSVVLVSAPGLVADAAWMPTITARMPWVNFINAYSGSRPQRNARILAQLDETRPNIIVTTHDGIGIRKNYTPHIPALHDQSYSAIVIDESHLVLPMDYDYPPQATVFWRGLMGINNDPKNASALRLAISGTPDRSKNWYRFGTWRFLFPRQLAPAKITYDQWLTRTFVTYDVEVPVKGRHGIFMKKLRRVGRLKDVEAWTRVDRTFTIRRTKAEVASEMPEKLYIDVDLEYPDALLVKYREHAAEFLNNDDGTRAAATLFALRAQQFATCAWGPNEAGIMQPVVGGPSKKLEWIIDWLTARGYHPDAPDPTGGQVVIASISVRVLRWLETELQAVGIPSLVIEGSMTVQQRTNAQKAFQSGAVRVALLSAKLGVGIDLDAADDLIFIDIPRDPDTQEQVEDRIHRISRVHNVTIWRLRSRSTIDMTISAINDQIFHQTRGLLDGAREVAFARKILARV